MKFDAVIGNGIVQNRYYKFTSKITGKTVTIQLLPDDIIVDGELRRIVRDENGQIPKWACPKNSKQDYIRVTLNGRVYGKTKKEVKTLQPSGRLIIQGLDEYNVAKSISLLKGLAIAYLPDHVLKFGWPKCTAKMPIDITTLYEYISKERTSNGYGINSFKNGIPTQVNGTKTLGYRAFQHMHHRCSDKYIENHPTYKGCFVADEFKDFQDFQPWFADNIYYVKSGTMEVDKDILRGGYYSMKTCLIVPNYINTYICNSIGDHKGALKQGNGFQSQSSIFKQKNKQKYLGYFKTVEEAHQAWVEFKNKQLQEVVIPYFIEDILPEYKTHPMALKTIEALKNYRFK